VNLQSCEAAVGDTVQYVKIDSGDKNEIVRWGKA
jgi:hypothetical protein